MPNIIEAEIDQETKSKERLSPKEFAKKKRREAYERFKEQQKNDPRHIAMKEKQKQQRRDIYQKAKERRKSFAAERKKEVGDKAAKDRAIKDQELMRTITMGNKMKPIKISQEENLKDDPPLNFSK